MTDLLVIDPIQVERVVMVRVPTELCKDGEAYYAFTGLPREERITPGVGVLGLQTVLVEPRESVRSTVTEERFIARLNVASVMGQSMR